MRLLALEPDQALTPASAAVTRIGDRIYFVVGRGRDASVFGEQQIDDDTTLYSTGPCGEEPRLIAHDIVQVLQRERWPDLLLGQTHRGDLVALDPQGELSPELVMKDVRTDRGWSDAGIIEVRGGETGEAPRQIVLRHPVSVPGDAELEPEVLVDEVRAWGNVVMRSDELLYVTPNDEIHQLSIPEGTSTLEAADVHSFDITPNGRFLVLEGRPDPEGYRAVRVRDRQTREELEVGYTDRSVAIDDDHVVLYARDLPKISNRIVLLPDLEVVDAEPLVFVLARHDETRWIAWRNPSSFLLYDHETRGTARLTSVLGTARHYRDRIDNLLTDSPGSVSATLEGSLEATWYEGGGPRRVADRATMGYRRLADDRIATPVDADDHSSLGTLAVTDFEGRTRWQIDTDVLVWFRNHQDRVGHLNTLLYSVSDGDRSGIWLSGVPLE